MSELEESIVLSKDIYKGRILNVKVEEVQLADGERVGREIVYHPGAVAIVPLTEKETVMLVRQYRLAARKALLEIPAGVLEPGESPEECAARELAEEVGLHPKRLHKLCATFIAPGYSSEVIHIFLAEELEKKLAQPDRGERLQRVEMPLQKAIEMVRRGEFLDAKTTVGLMLAKSLLDERNKSISKRV